MPAARSQIATETPAPEGRASRSSETPERGGDSKAASAWLHSYRCSQSLHLRPTLPAYCEAPAAAQDACRTKDSNTVRERAAAVATAIAPAARAAEVNAAIVVSAAIPAHRGVESCDWPRVAGSRRSGRARHILPTLGARRSRRAHEEQNTAK